MQTAPHLAYFDIVPARMIQEPKEHVYSHLRMLEMLSSYMRQLRVLMLKCTSTIQ